jgi:hypothetical protein
MPLCLLRDTHGGNLVMESIGQALTVAYLNLTGYVNTL